MHYLLEVGLFLYFTNKTFLSYYIHREKQVELDGVGVHFVF